MRRAATARLNRRIAVPWTSSGRCGRPPGQRDAAAEVGLRAERAALQDEVKRLAATLARDFPAYAALLQPAPLSLAAAQALLRPDEALLTYIVTREQSYLWVIRPGQAALRVLPVGREALAAQVAALRRGLDPRPGHLETFDVAAAHTLYRDLLAPAAGLLDGAEHLILVPESPLESLPFAVLVTEPPPERPGGTFGRYRQAAWLGTQKALTVLPAVASLHALRGTAALPPGAEPFLGFGEPALLGPPVVTADAGGVTATGGVADVESVRRLAALPGTGAMLRAIGAALGADPAATVITGAEATVTRARQSPLDRYRVLAFAIHGLIAGDVRGLEEPGLVLTPPEVSTPEDDGVLAASEIVQLQLNADWVLLTACNTAASDGTPGAEGLSGLARAFFYAGARSLLVSHWSVDRQAAIALTRALFHAQGAPGGKAAALREAMRAMIEGRIDDEAPREFAHPAYWAPFVVVGEGA